MPRISPYLFYEDAEAAADFLIRAFGFEEHRERARGAGAEILTELAEQPNGDRRYDVADPEGHMWSFAVSA